MHSSPPPTLRRGPRRVLLVALALLVGALGCASEAEPVEEPASFQPDVNLWLSPASASPELTRTITITSDGSAFEAGATTVDFGPGVFVQGVLVDASFRLRATVTVLPDAEIGPRDVTVVWPDGQRILRDGFVVESGSIELAPRAAALGETVELEVTGWNTEFVPNFTTVSLGEGITLPDAPEVLSSSRLRVVAHVDPRAAVGPRDLVVYNAGTFWTLDRAFHVDRVDRVMTVVPDEAEQGTTLELRVQAEDADFAPEQTVLDLGTGIVIEDVTVIDSEHLAARVRIGNNAREGARDVMVETLTADGPRVRVLLDGFTVHGIDANPLRARASLSFSISRSFDPDLCFFDERVSATALFYEPNDFPCPSNGGSSSLSVPGRFDLVGTGFSNPATGSTDCPATKTFDAGPTVAFVSGDDEVVLQRDYDPVTSRIVYRASGLTADDYVPDRWWALETTGGDLGFSELPPWSIEDAVRTMPRDYQQTGPDYCDLVHTLSEPLRLRWTPGGTYDSADMYAYLLGPMTDQGNPLMFVYPWDDGAWDFTPETLSFFDSGPADLLQIGVIRARFDVPGSEYPLAGIASSTIQWRGSFTFAAP